MHTWLLASYNLFFYICIYCLERGEGRHRFVVPLIYTLLVNSCVPRLGIEPATSVLWDDTPNNWATWPGPEKFFFFFNLKKKISFINFDDRLNHSTPQGNLRKWQHWTGQSMGWSSNLSILLSDLTCQACLTLCSIVTREEKMPACWVSTLRKRKL